MAHMESLWPRLAELPLVVESCEYDRLHAVLAHEFQRVTTHALRRTPARPRRRSWTRPDRSTTT